MALVQKGYLGTTGPVFVDDSAVAGKFLIYQGIVSGNTVSYVAKLPAYASNLTGFLITPDQCSLGGYQDNQQVVITPTYKTPPAGNAGSTYLNIADDWVAGTATATTTGGGGNTGGGGSTGGGSTTGGGGTTGGGVTTGGGTTTDTTYKAPTVMEQISTFLSNYWWLVALVIIALLYKPVIAPALGLSKKKRR